MRKSLTALILSVLTAAPFMQADADEISVGLSDHTAQVRYATTVNSRMVLDAGWTHHEEHGNLLEVGFYGFSRVNQLDIKIGGRGFWVELDGPDGQGISVGSAITYKISKVMALDTAFFYAPSVTSFKEISHFRHFNLGLRYTVLDNSHIFLAYRDIEADTKGTSTDSVLHEGGFVGFKILF